MAIKLTPCGELARQHDPDRFFLTALADPSGTVAQHLWALIAFNYEISRTRETVSDTTIGLIRLQWWRDALGAIYSGQAALQQDVISALAEAIRLYKLPQEQFETLIYGREFDLEDRLPASLDGLMNYADYTHTPLVRLCLLALGSQEECRDIAMAYAITGLLRAVLYHARQRRCYLPEDLLQSANVSTTLLYDLKEQTGLAHVIESVAQQVEQLLHATQPQHKYLKGMKALTRLYLKQMRACDYNPFKPAWVKPVPFKEVRVLLAAL